MANVSYSEPQPKFAKHAEDSYDGAPYPMVDPASRCIGSYGDVVLSLRDEMRKLRAHVAEGKLEIAVFGHGGRDTNCWLAIVEAMAEDEDLRAAVCVSVYSCSWPDDAWEEVMASFVADLENRGKVLAGAISFNMMKYHEECNVLAGRVAGHLKGTHLIIQCEQGTDMFVEPVTAEWLQDNYEDCAMHNLCIAHAEETGIPVWLVQTNADLDLSRGIDREEVSMSIFGGQLQTEAFNVKLKAIDDADAGRSDSLIQLACKLGQEKDKKVAFLRDLNYDTAKHGDMPSFYSSFIVFAAHTTQAALPVAGIIEVLFALLNNAHRLPWGLEVQAPTPQWVSARFLLPREAEGNRIRIVSQFRDAGLHTASTFAELFARWMFARFERRQRRNVVAENSRFKNSFWEQLTLAKGVADQVLSKVPEFQLWRNGSCDLLQRALESVGEQTKTYPKQVGGGRNVNWDETMAMAQSTQPDFGNLTPLWKWAWGSNKMILDFTCRLLESPRGIEEEYALILTGLPVQPQNLKITPSIAASADLLRDALVAQANCKPASFKVVPMCVANSILFC